MAFYEYHSQNAYSSFKHLETRGIIKLLGHCQVDNFNSYLSVVWLFHLLNRGYQVLLVLISC